MTEPTKPEDPSIVRLLPGGARPDHGAAARREITAALESGEMEARMNVMARMMKCKYDALRHAGFDAGEALSIICAAPY